MAERHPIYRDPDPVTLRWVEDQFAGLYSEDIGFDMIAAAIDHYPRAPWLTVDDTGRAVRMVPVEMVNPALGATATLYQPVPVEDVDI